jgi:hypothetical protein
MSVQAPRPDVLIVGDPGSVASALIEPLSQLSLTSKQAPQEHAAPAQLDPLARKRAEHQLSPALGWSVIEKNPSSSDARVLCRPRSVIPAAIARRLSSAAQPSDASTRTASPSTRAGLPAATHSAASAG